jgi:hypothetical protein
MKRVIPPRILTVGVFLASLGLMTAEEVFIRASQIGYRPQDTKVAIAFAKSGLPRAFAVVTADTENEVFAGQAKPVAGLKWGGLENHAELDFSLVKAPGRYVIRVGDSKSLPFAIGAEVYDELPGQLLEFMREQRCGYNPWLDAVCHPFDGRTAYGPLTNGTYLDARGGWHDAADLLKYLLTSGNATAQMLLAYQAGSLESKAQSLKSKGGGRASQADQESGALGAGLDAQAAPRARPALSPGRGRSRPHGTAPAAERDCRLRLGQRRAARCVFRRRPAPGPAEIQERIHGRG